ncbi:hypothetical protein KOR34_36070 [Posidoniimonas corsicana]|uniref:Methyltransferase type 11 domain-containing protein n=1 Tax=Posidoniimonas corsicana TaxID=1938618 RepID=A0A5C5V731_9BACT|nr:hypothetical protein KOR34_36070 [Posidoniimonas corsicana]
MLASKYAEILQAYRRGDSRHVVFRKLVECDLTANRGGQKPVTLLDIGCGAGFDKSHASQLELAKMCDEFWGVEPDESVLPPACFDRVYRDCFESVDIPKDSVDVAYAVMVLEHVSDPSAFWHKVRGVLRTGGVFWGFTVNSRHAFALASSVLGRLRLKDWYLDSLRGSRGVERYENYRTYYRCNTPEHIQRHAAGFECIECDTLHRVGQLDYYIPSYMRWVSHAWDRHTIRSSRPGSVLVVRAQK